MKAWLDTEFNEFGGELISIALVDELGREFYEVVEHNEPKSWVAEHVIPKLGKTPIPYSEMQFRLRVFLGDVSWHVIADWPDDIKFLCEALITGPGMSICPQVLVTEIRRGISSDKSEVQHNALFDARAIRDDYLSK